MITSEITGNTRALKNQCLNTNSMSDIRETLVKDLTTMPIIDFRPMESNP